MSQVAHRMLVASKIVATIALYHTKLMAKATVQRNARLRARVRIIQFLLASGRGNAFAREFLLCFLELAVACVLFYSYHLFIFLYHSCIIFSFPYIMYSYSILISYYVCSNDSDYDKHGATTGCDCCGDNVGGRKMCVWMNSASYLGW